MSKKEYAGTKKMLKALREVLIKYQKKKKKITNKAIKNKIDTKFEE